LAERSAQLAVDLAGKIIQHKLTPADHAKLITEAVDRFSTPSQN
jgi:F0F1-type ATP synthase membrane subunit b/b'